MLAGDKGALQVGDVLVDLEGVQRRVVPGEFEQRAVARRDFRRRLAVGHLTLVLRDQFQHRCFADGGDSDDQRMAASWQELGELLHVLRYRMGEKSDFLLDNAGGVRHRIAELQRLVEAAEADDAFHPVVHRRHADLDLQHQSVGAPHVVHLQRLLTAQLDQLRLLLNRDGAYAQHVAARRQRAVIDGANPSEPAAEQAAQGGAAEGGRHAAQFQACRSRRLVQVPQPDAGLGPRSSVARPHEGVVAAHVQQHAAVQRHGLAVISGPAAAHGNRHAQPRAQADEPADFVFAARTHDRLRALVCQLAFEHRTEP